jgi:nucleotide-binding universal stress UspA family protein
MFVVVGEGLARAGPAVVLSFVLAAITCLFSALSYAERASSIPVAGSAAPLTLCSVLGQSSERYSYLVGRTDEQAFLDKARDSFGKALEFAAAGVPPELEPRTVLLEGAVVDSLAALGPDDVDMLVCGSRGYGPVRRVLLGGVSSRLIRGARLPVAVVPRAATASAE